MRTSEPSPFAPETSSRAWALAHDHAGSKSQVLDRRHLESMYTTSRERNYVQMTKAYPEPCRHVQGFQIRRGKSSESGTNIPQVRIRMS